jgi:hypothetical protein
VIVLTGAGLLVAGSVMLLSTHCRQLWSGCSCLAMMVSSNILMMGRADHTAWATNSRLAKYPSDRASTDLINRSLTTRSEHFNTHHISASTRPTSLGGHCSAARFRRHAHSL